MMPLAFTATTSLPPSPSTSAASGGAEVRNPSLDPGLGQPGDG